QGSLYATDQRARSINISSSTTDESRVLRDAVQYADSKGVLIVAAAGNTGDRANLQNYPAAYPEVLAVGASDRADKVPLFSQRQPYIRLVAPAIDIPTTPWPGAGRGSYALPTGTSAAAPHVSGAAALLVSVRPALTTWYFAEGSTQPPFETSLALFNPNPRPADVHISYMSPDGLTTEQQLRLPPDCRQSVRVNDVVPNEELSIRIDSNDTVFAE